MADDDVFSGSPEDLRIAGDKMNQLSTLLGKIYEGPAGKIRMYPGLNGNHSDDISNMLYSQIDPAMKGCLEFLKNLMELANGHGNILGDVGNMFEDMNDFSTNEANGHHGGRH